MSPETLRKIISNDCPPLEENHSDGFDDPADLTLEHTNQNNESADLAKDTVFLQESTTNVPISRHPTSDSLPEILEQTETLMVGISNMFEIMQCSKKSQEITSKVERQPGTSHGYNNKRRRIGNI